MSVIKNKDISSYLYPIENNVPIPGDIPRRSKCWFPTDALMVGQSFRADHSDYGAVNRNVTRRNRDGSGKRFVLRVVTEGVRVWRVL